MRFKFDLDFLLPQNQTNHQGRQGTSKAHSGHHVYAIVERKARRDMVGAHHEGHQQQGGKCRHRQGFGFFSHALIVRDRGRGPWHAGD